MVNPTISQKTDQRLTLTEDTKKLFQVIYREKKKEEKTDSSQDEIPKIVVSDMVSKMAFYYEKIRNSVDYKEEHLLRKYAIERILKRQIIIEKVISVKDVTNIDISRHLLTELIRAAYLPNNKIPEIKIEEIALVIEKFLKLKHFCSQCSNFNHSKYKEKNVLNKWIIALMASEIEEKLSSSKVDETVVAYMGKILNSNIDLPSDSPYYKDKEIQINVGIYRNLLKFDRDMQSLILFKYFNPDWQNPTDDNIKKIADKFLLLFEKVNYQIDHPLSGQLNRIVSRYTVFFSILTDVIAEDPEGVYENFRKDPKAFPRQIKKISNFKYREAKTKLWRAAVRSIIYIFITKSVFALFLEVPAAKWFDQDVNMFSLIINISFPAALLFLIILFTKLPSQANSDKIVEGVEEIVFEEQKRANPFVLRRPVKRGQILHTVFGLLYTVTFFLSFGAVIWLLSLINFNWLSITIFLFFLAFVSFFSIRIRKSAKELIIVESKENIFTFVIDFFYVPIVASGKWLSEKFSRINVFVFFLDFIIEAPFKIFVEMAEEWTKYVKERKDELI